LSRPTAAWDCSEDAQTSPGMTPPCLPDEVMPLDELLARWRPGSYEQPWTWDDEDEDIWTHPHTPALAAHIAAEGIQEPVLLGRDGRVWDGHHRICVARRLGLDDIPVRFIVAPEATDR
jgi:hypothetical protein